MSCQKPEMPYGYLGPKDKFEELGMSTVTHNSPEIRCHESELKLTLKISDKTKVAATLLDTNTPETEFKENILVQTLGQLVNLNLSFPHAGFFKLQIYALPGSDRESTKLPNVYNYLIHCTKGPAGKACCFPKQYTQWKEGCYLFHPFTLKGVDSANIKVNVPGARAVALHVEDQWFPLKQRDRQQDEKSDAPIPWSGTVEGLQKWKGKKASLTANFDEKDDTKYASLLEYEL